MSDHDHNDGGHHHTEPMAVAVITPSGTFPNDDNYRRSYDGAHVEKILKAAAVHLHLTNTGDWVAYVDNRQIDPAIPAVTPDQQQQQKQQQQESGERGQKQK